MSAAVWPPLAPAELEKEVQSELSNELQWLLSSIQDTLRELKAGLEECAELLAPAEPGSTLVLSSLRSECLKGFVTRVGTRIVKGDIKLRMPSLPPPKGSPCYPLAISSAPQAPVLVLEQLTAARTLVNACLDVVDASSWAGDPADAHFIAGQLRLLDVNVQEAKAALKGGSDAHTTPWWEAPADEKIFDPPLPSLVSFHLAILDAGLLLEVRILEPATPPAPASTGESALTAAFGLRDRLAAALGAAAGATRPPVPSEGDDVFTFAGQEVRVRDKVRVESQDPSLMAAMAKLNALERTVALARRALDIVMGKDE